MAGYIIKKPEVSVIILTYNRSHLLERAIQSALNQSFNDFEIILINNGSTDDTEKILKKYQHHKKIRTYSLEKNIGFVAGMNFAFDRLNGEWFCQLGDDDKINPNALSMLLGVVDQIDKNINMVTCNGIDSETNLLIGEGLKGDQILTLKEILGKMSGNWWGITKTSLIDGHRFNEKLRWNVDVFWLKIHATANHYYIHQPLLEWNTGNPHTETAMMRHATIEENIEKFRELIKEEEYWDILSQYNPKKCIDGCLRGVLFMAIGSLSQEALRYRKMIIQLSLPDITIRYLTWILIHTNPGLLKRIYLAFKGMIRFRCASQPKLTLRPQNIYNRHVNYIKRLSLEFQKQ